MFCAIKSNKVLSNLFRNNKGNFITVQVKYNFGLFKLKNFSQFKQSKGLYKLAE